MSQSAFVFPTVNLTSFFLQSSHTLRKTSYHLGQRNGLMDQGTKVCRFWMLTLSIKCALKKNYMHTHIHIQPAFSLHFLFLDPASKVLSSPLNHLFPCNRCAGRVWPPATGEYALWGCLQVGQWADYFTFLFFFSPLGCLPCLFPPWPDIKREKCVVSSRSP